MSSRHRYLRHRLAGTSILPPKIVPGAPQGAANFVQALFFGLSEIGLIFRDQPNHKRQLEFTQSQFVVLKLLSQEHERAFLQMKDKCPKYYEAEEHEDNESCEFHIQDN